MVPSHLRGRRRDRENGWYHATEENEFFPVHNVVGFLKIKPGGIRKLRPATVRKGNAVVTFRRADTRRSEFVKKARKFTRKRDPERASLQHQSFLFSCLDLNFAP